MDRKELWCRQPDWAWECELCARMQQTTDLATLLRELHRVNEITQQLRRDINTAKISWSSAEDSERGLSTTCHAGRVIEARVCELRIG